MISIIWKYTRFNRTQITSVNNQARCSEWSSAKVTLGTPHLVTFCPVGRQDVRVEI